MKKETLHCDVCGIEIIKPEEDQLHNSESTFLILDFGQKRKIYLKIHDSADLNICSEKCMTDFVHNSEIKIRKTQ